MLEIYLVKNEKLEGHRRDPIAVLVWGFMGTISSFSGEHYKMDDKCVRRTRSVISWPQSENYKECIASLKLRVRVRPLWESVIQELGYRYWWGISLGLFKGISHSIRKGVPRQKNMKEAFVKSCLILLGKFLKWALHSTSRGTASKVWISMIRMAFPRHTD